MTATHHHSSYSSIISIVQQRKVTVDRPGRCALIDFTGTAPQQPTNFNAPIAIAQVLLGTILSSAAWNPFLYFSTFVSFSFLSFLSSYEMAIL
jgi:N-methylhydantoinase B/oxoprolinase/acetone carboxylase alpha subunit